VIAQHGQSRQTAGQTAAAANHVERFGLRGAAQGQPVLLWTHEIAIERHIRLAGMTLDDPRSQ
jgi:hypothetical protein